MEEKRFPQSETIFFEIKPDDYAIYFIVQG